MCLAIGIICHWLLVISSWFVDKLSYYELLLYYPLRIDLLWFATGIICNCYNQRVSSAEGGKEANISFLCTHSLDNYIALAIYIFMFLFTQNQIFLFTQNQISCMYVIPTFVIYNFPKTLWHLI